MNQHDLETKIPKTHSKWYRRLIDAAPPDHGAVKGDDFGLAYR